MRNSITVLTLVGSSLLALSACGSDDGSDGIAGEQEWCATIGDVDDLLASADSIDDFADARAVYEQAGGDVQRLIAAVDVVDESVRSDVTTTLQWVAELTSAIADAPDEAAADAALAPFFESFPGTDDRLPGDAWILETCGVDIND